MPLALVLANQAGEFMAGNLLQKLTKQAG